MSFFGNLFGKKQAAAPTTSEAIQKLRETEEMLEKKQLFLENKISQELAIAKQNGTKNKRAAIQALKRRKRYQKQLEQIDGTLSTIEMQRGALENANTNSTVLQTMKNAADALKAAHMDMDVDKVHDMMDDIAEQQDVAKEISDAISNPVAFGQDVDEDELEKELEELEQEALDEELLGVDTTVSDLPAIPVPSEPVPVARKPKAKPVEEDDDLKQLEAWASNLFGKKQPPAPTTSEAIQKLRQVEEMLEKKQVFLETKIAQELTTAKKYGSKNKRAAIQALKKKKRYEKQLEQIDGTLSTIEMQRSALENANTNAAVLKAMKDAADAQKAAHMNMDVDQVHDMMDDIAEQQDVAREISDAISNPVAFGHEVDDDELEKELEQLEQEALDEELLGVDTTVSDLPAIPVPSKPVPIARKSKAKTLEDDADLRELEAWAT
ncbi:hypothetical protein PV325_013587 [Microctonus aethiopoides]|nr:hypothetical protein PV325_013587 [Microctonus aethiopoides]KAK0091678.1 hypothetical protein PV326_002864 [Microctonus aethiopoides]